MSLGNNDRTTAEGSGSPRLSQRGARVTLRVLKEKRGVDGDQIALSYGRPERPDLPPFRAS